MFEGKNFYFNSMRKVVVGFGALFNSVVIVREDNDSATSKTISIPLAYSPREHYMATLRDKTDGLQISLPRLSYEMTGLQYDPTRKLATTGYNKGEISTPAVQEFYRQLNPVPYVMTFDLNVYTRTIEDSLQIIEQIVPYFTPSFNISIKEISELNISRDVPITLEGIVQDDSYQSLVEDDRVITWTLSFSANINLYQPIDQSKVILKAIADVKTSIENTDETITAEVSPITAKESEPHTIITTIS